MKKKNILFQCSRISKYIRCKCIKYFHLHFYAKPFPRVVQTGIRRTGENTIDNTSSNGVRFRSFVRKGAPGFYGQYAPFVPAGVSGEPIRFFRVLLYIVPSVRPSIKLHPGPRRLIPPRSKIRISTFRKFVLRSFIKFIALKYNYHFTSIHFQVCFRTKMKVKNENNHSTY